MKNFAAAWALTAALAFNACMVFGQKVPVSEIIQQVDVLMSNYQFNKALVFMNKAGDSLDMDLLRRKGLCYSKLGNYNDAILAYESIRNIDSINREALHQLGQLYSVTDQ